jgi:predicted TPR repeat methyltransferase
MNSYYDGLNQKLLHAIPTNARKVLELGCANGRLGQRYKELNRKSRWVGIDIAASADKRGHFSPANTPACAS